ncbi:transporter substrate-binding domain-containing protein [Colwellia sp. M166]|uniref:substrate-binding periplasmic protein n=1 Tax=Colwellia sp. M166 TaxID=2583805 RepID=UPI00211F3499|nr:transporter substrate-binding domain-containing protein [Colwellia sp. M166]UUO24728.1 transporter substrate-binding domain-containing protein [Colwellia sp. M166]|tara:strand:- start:25219 stop:26013 length:795 start_codon:yes stop_codon:yes gene_type:complete
MPRDFCLFRTVKNKLINSFVLSVIFFCNSVVSANINIVTEHLAPFQIVNGKNIAGLSTEIIKAVLKEAKLPYSLTANPWSLSYNSALHEKNSCIYSLAHIPQRKALFQWIGHIATSTASLYALKSNKIVVTNLTQAKNYKIAVIKDDVSHHFLLSKGFVENKNLYVMNNYDSLLKLLEIPSRQIDLVVLNDDLLNNRVQNSTEAAKYKNQLFLKELALDFYFACSLNTDKSTVNILINAMKKLEQRGEITAIKNKWRPMMINLI